MTRPAVVTVALPVDEVVQVVARSLSSCPVELRTTAVSRAVSPLSSVSVEGVTATLPTTIGGVVGLVGVGSSLVLPQAVSVSASAAAG